MLSVRMLNGRAHWWVSCDWWCQPWRWKNYAPSVKVNDFQHLSIMVAGPFWEHYVSAKPLVYCQVNIVASAGERGRSRSQSVGESEWSKAGSAVPGALCEMIAFYFSDDYNYQTALMKCWSVIDRQSDWRSYWCAWIPRDSLDTDHVAVMEAGKSSGKPVLAQRPQREGLWLSAVC